MGSRLVAADDLLSAILAFCRDQGMAETTFGRRAVNDGKFVDNLDQPSTGFYMPNIEAIPEPATSALLLLGLGFLVRCRRKSGRARAVLEQFIPQDL